MLRSLYEEVKIVALASPLTADAATDRNSTVLDTLGYQAFTILYHCGPLAANRQEFLVSWFHGSSVTCGGAFWSSR